ncbi:MAG: phosphoribosyl-AMP cyclohydrolase [Pseudomonadota bacterium]
MSIFDTSLWQALSRGEIEEGRAFAPHFGADGLIPVIAVDAESGAVLMLAHMNAEALARTLATGDMYYWSRARNALWRKGATSGHVQKLVTIQVDCDQDCLLARVQQEGAACHVGYKTCFYRRVAVEGDGAGLSHPEGEKLFDPVAVYGAKDA